jgi:hypothetical protein
MKRAGRDRQRARRFFLELWTTLLRKEFGSVKIQNSLSLLLLAILDGVATPCSRGCLATKDRAMHFHFSPLHWVHTHLHLPATVNAGLPLLQGGEENAPQTEGASPVTSDENHAPARAAVSELGGTHPHSHDGEIDEMMLDLP